MSGEFINSQDVQKQFWNAMYKFGQQLEHLSTDLQAMEIITAVGTTTVKFKSENPGGDNSLDITSLANSNNNTTNIIDGNITILARTRFELDGDLLVILPTKQKIFTPSSSPTPGAAGGTVSPTSPSNPVQSNTYEIDTDILDLHKQNVDLALQNLQFVYGKAMELLTTLAGGNDNILNRIGNKLGIH